LSTLAAGFAHKLWKTMCAKQAGESQALESKEKTSASTKNGHARERYTPQHSPSTVPQAGIVPSLTTGQIGEKPRRRRFGTFFTNFVEKIVSKRLDPYQSN
jgi:hypothetical protein